MKILTYLLVSIFATHFNIQKYFFDVSLALCRQYCIIESLSGRGRRKSLFSVTLKYYSYQRKISFILLSRYFFFFSWLIFSIYFLYTSFIFYNIFHPLYFYALVPFLFLKFTLLSNLPTHIIICIDLISFFYKLYTYSYIYACIHVERMFLYDFVFISLVSTL